MRPFHRLKLDAHKFHEWSQGALAIVGIIAITTGGILYFAERRSKPRVILEPRATVVGIGQKVGEGRLDAVLLQFSVAIENRSSRGLIFNCAAIDIIGLRGEAQRQSTYTDDLIGTSLLPALQNNPNWSKCVRDFEQRRRADEHKWYKVQSKSDQWVNPPRPTPPPTDGARYRAFFMEPGEVMTKTWEHRVLCEYEAVRIIFKLPKPNSIHDYETKILVPIADVCANERNVSILRYAPVAPVPEGEGNPGLPGGPTTSADSG